MDVAGVVEDGGRALAEARLLDDLGLERRRAAVHDHVHDAQDAHVGVEAEPPLDLDGAGRTQEDELLAAVRRLRVARRYEGLARHAQGHGAVEGIVLTVAHDALGRGIPREALLVGLLERADGRRGARLGLRLGRLGPRRLDGLDRRVGGGGRCRGGLATAPACEGRARRRERQA